MLMSKSATVLTPPLDLEHDEPTQFMLQLMQTSIKRRIESRKKRFTKFFSIIASPFGMVLLLLLACPGLAALFSLKFNYPWNTHLITYYCSIVILLTNLMYIFFGFRFFTLLLIPIPINGSMLDVSRNERLILSSLMGRKRWSFINRQLEIENPVKLIRKYLNYILFTQTAFLIAGLSFGGILTSFQLTDYIRFSIVCVILTGLLVSLMLSTFRIVIALKLIMHNLNWSALTQQLVIFFWLCWWSVIGLLSKILFLGRDFDNGKYMYIRVTSNSVYLAIMSLVYFLFMVYSTYKLWNNMKISKIFSKSKLYRFDWSINQFYILILVTPLPFFYHEFMRLSLSKYISFKDINFSYTLTAICLVSSIIFAFLLSKWLKSNDYIKRSKLIHLVIYLFSTIILSIIFIGLRRYHVIIPNSYKSEEINYIINYITRFTSIYVTLPSPWVFIDLSFTQTMNSISSNNSGVSFKVLGESIFQMYIIVSVFPSLFARFIENIALQAPIRPKI